MKDKVRLNRWLIIFLLLFVFSNAIFASGQSEELKVEQKVVHGLMAGDISNLDPALSFVSVEAPIITTVYEGLVDYLPGEISENFQPALAKSWDISKDGKEYTFYLREGVQWHGEFGEFTAEDVKYSLDRYCNPDESSWAGEYTNVKDVTIIDKYTVKVTLKKRDAFFLAKVATNTMSAGVMFSKRAFEEQGVDKMRLNPIGTGPFQFSWYNPNDRVVLTKNPNYWGGEPILDKIEYVFMPDQTTRELAMEANEIQTMRCTSDAIVIDRLISEGFILDAVGVEIFWWLNMDTTVPPLNDIRVRKAIMHAIDSREVEAFVGKKVARSFQGEGIMAKTYFGAAKQEDLPVWFGTFDPDESRKLLNEAGYPNGFKLEMLITERSDYLQMMIILQEQLKRVGIDLQLNTVDHTYYHSQIRKGVNPLVFYGDLSYPDTLIILQRFFQSKSNQNFSKFHSEQMDALIQKIQDAPDFDTRAKLLIQAQKIIAENVLIVPIIYTLQPLFRRPEVNLGYELKSSLVLNYRFTKDSYIEKLKD